MQTRPPRRMPARAYGFNSLPAQIKIKEGWALQTRPPRRMPVRAYGFNSLPAHVKQELADARKGSGFNSLPAQKILRMDSIMAFGLSSEIKIKVNPDKDCVHTVSVEWPTEKVKEKIEEAFVSVQGQAKIPGFRPGKSPLELVKKSFQETAYARAQDILLREGVTEAIKVKKINAVSTPVVQTFQFSPDQPFQFEFKVEVVPNFKLSGHKGLKLSQVSKSITEENVEKSLKNIADANAQLIESEQKTLSPHHFAVVSYEGFLDGKSIPGAKADNFLMDLSAPQAISGLTEGLIGAQVGEERDVTVKFPEDSPAKDLAGKDAIFKVKLVTIKEKKTPAIDDDFAKDLGFDSLAALKAKVRENLEADLKQSQKRELGKQITEKLLEENKFPVPLSLIEDQTKHIINRQQSRLLRQGLTKEDLDKLTAQNLEATKKQAEKDIRLAYILDSISESEKISATEAEIQRSIEEIISRAEPSEQAVLKIAFQGEYKARVQNEVREKKIFEWLIQNAKIKPITDGST